ncbi:NAD kinase-like isoform X2 [Anneissia japonica]|uniref:NAD kinase-like isoform X2 n=1 Tax=Anneissia japonica TaxID=1529436 RepID=UPI001425B07A|nr:NAD kinase-like isoform X2 [Anneissia japonica]
MQKNENNHGDFSRVYERGLSLAEEGNTFTGLDSDDSFRPRSLETTDFSSRRRSVGQMTGMHRQRAIRRGRSIYAPTPSPSFGPKACLKKVHPSQIMHVTDPSSQVLMWKVSALSVLVIKKIYDESVIEPFKVLVTFLSEEKNLVVFVEAGVQKEESIVQDENFSRIRNKMKTFKEGDNISDKVDFIVCLGGDGTLLYASSLFQQGSVPPVMAFSLGSLGFLTPFDFDFYKESINSVLKGNLAVTLRSRLNSHIYTDDKIPNNHHNDDNDMLFGNEHKDPDPPNLKFKCQVLNEVVIDRGPSPFLSNLDLYLDGSHITTVQGDGLIISTPTGSTAYAAAAGASMIHPNVPAIMITPICPHSLSFRPIIIPAGVELKIMVPPDARHTAWVSHDGRNRQEIHKGYAVHITTSIYPVACVCRRDQISDWFDSLGECLHWNIRQRQKAMTTTCAIKNGEPEKIEKE